MPWHHWGDDWQHWDELGQAIRCVINAQWKMGRIAHWSSKEKYGTFRDYATFWDGSLHGALWPGYRTIKNRFIYWKLDIIIKPLTKWTGMRWLVCSYQKAVYNYTFQKACKKFPNVIDELVSDAAFPEFIKPGLFGSIDGQKIHDKYWTRVGE